MAAYTTVDDAGSVYNTVLYTSTGSTMNITGAGFQPDFTWIKARDENVKHLWFDSVRGVTKYLQSNDSAVEVTAADTLTAFDSDGYTIGTSADLNNATELYVSWNWKLGTTSGLTGGTITPTSYSFNATSGVGIYAYNGTGATGTITHGLGAVPKFMLNKRYEEGEGAQEWKVYGAQESMGATKFMVLDQQDIPSVRSDIWNDTAPTSTVFTIGSEISTSGVDFVQYVFAEVQGFSKFGQYIGNGDADGTFVYTGFRPAFFMIKRTDSTNNWWIVDNKRVGYNVDNNILFADLTQGKDDGNYVDILSNGLKTRTTDGGLNVLSGTYIYVAFAEAPFANSNGVACNAR